MAMLNDPSIKTAIGALVEICINKALQHDPATSAKLATLQGCTVHIACESPSLDLAFTIEASSIRVSSHIEGQADVVLSGSASDFLSAIGEMGEHTHSLANTNIAVSGKVNILQQIKNALSGLHIDWEDMLAQLIGSLPAHLSAELARSVYDYSQQRQHAFDAHLPHYLSEELNAIPSPTELENFYTAVDDVKSSTQRLEARLHELAKRLELILTPTNNSET